MTWWQGFFDAAYLRLWNIPDERTQAEASGLWTLLGLEPGCAVLDAPCGAGRIARALAQRGATVLGVDQSEPMIARAEADRGDLPAARLRHRVHDLRRPLDEGGFDAAVNIFSSLGYGSEDDDLAILGTLAAAVRPGGRVFVDTMHRDVLVAHRARGASLAQVLADGTLFIETARFDAVAGRNETTWRWAGPAGTGEKHASLRLYTITELVRLLERAGLRFESAHRGCSPAPFVSDGPDAGGRVGLLAYRLP